MNTVIRWIVLLPSAIVVAFLISFPLRIVLYTTLSNFIEPYPELPERLLFPFFASMVFIWIGSKVAPSRKLLVANLLMILWIVLLLIFPHRIKLIIQILLVLLILILNQYQINK